MNRKVIQITSALDSDGDAILHALCDDGTIWERCFISGGGLYWRQIEEINELLNADTEEKAISFAKDWNIKGRPKLNAIAQNPYGEWYGFTGNVRLENYENGKRWKYGGEILQLNKLLRQKKAVENGTAESWEESLVIIEETTKCP